MRVIAGDIGGTKTLVALAEVDGDRVRVLDEARYDSQSHGSLDEIVARFAAGRDVAGLPAGFGVAGPVVDERCVTTNLPWVIDARTLGRPQGLARVALCNDFEAAARGVVAVAPEHRVALQPGVAVPGAPEVVIGAGTGLGEATRLARDGREYVLPGEGGHADFAPRDEREVGLLRFLQARHGRVSVERVVSGPGLVAIHEYLAAEGRAVPAAVRDAMAREDPAAVIGQLAVSGGDSTCVEALELLLGAYGAEAGNLALKLLARGGVYLAGGIAAKVLPVLQKGRFLEAFLDKGRMRPLLAPIPVTVITDPGLGLLGAARLAAA